MKETIKYACLFAVILVCGYSFGQNIVLNPSFESGSGPAEGVNALNNCNNWSNNSYGSVDYKGAGNCGGASLCAMEYAASPTSYMCNSYPATHGYGCGTPYDGNYGIGVYLAQGISTSAREAACGNLSTAMTPGTMYDITLTARNSSDLNISATAHTPSNIGVVLSTTPLTNADFNSWSAATWNNYDRVWSTTPTPNEWTTYTWSINVVNANQYLTVTGINPKSTWTYLGGNGSNWVGGYLWVDAVEITESSVLPVTDLEFNASNLEKGALLEWSTSTEINASHYVIQSSEDGRNFYDNGSVIAAGNSLETQYYEHVDTNAINGMKYYRVRQVDINGDFAYSDVKVVIQNYTDVEIMSLYPNPAINDLELSISSSQRQECEISIFSIDGELVKSSNSFLNEGLNPKRINVKNLSQGIYVLKVITPSGITENRFVKR